MTKTTSCRLGIHKWKQVGTPMPIFADTDFHQGFTGQWLAMGKCVRCGIDRLRGFYGASGQQIPVTKDEYIKKFNEGELSWL